MKALRITTILSIILLASCGGRTYKYSGKKLSQIMGYSINGSKITFRFNPFVFEEHLNIKKINPDTITNIRVTGSFVGWKQRAPWNMIRTTAGNWALTKDLESVMIPANSGRPEFAFCILTNGSKDVIWLKQSTSVDDGHRIHDQYHGEYNFIIMQKSDKPSEISRMNRMIVSIKSNDFKSTEAKGNFREIRIGKIGKNKLYRSYHPFVGSRNTYVEKQRMKAASDMIKKYNIKAIINLTDSKSVLGNKKMSPPYRIVQKNGGLLLAKTDYNDVYYKSTQPVFFKLLKKIFPFIIKKDGPFLIHCRLGTDRTGVISALLAGLMGASWKEIRLDYNISNETRMGEFRHANLLKYSFEKMLQIKITDKTIMKDLLIKFLTKKAGIKKSTIQRVIKKLQ